MSSTFVRYRPGTTPAVATQSMVALVNLPASDDRLVAVRHAVEANGEAEDVLDALLRHGIRALPDFAVCHWQGTAFRVVAQGAIEVRPEGGDPLPLTAVPWSDGTLHAEGVTLRLLNAPEPDGHPAQLIGLQEVAEVRFATGRIAEKLAQETLAKGQGGPVVEVMAALCPSGHPTPAFAPLCRVCGQAIPEQEPRMIPRPTLGTLRLSTGQTIPLDRGVILGRGPSVPVGYPHGPGDGGIEPRLVPVPDPNAYVSVRHLEISLDYWNVMVRDLRSTGGTRIEHLDGRREDLVPGERVVLPPGASVVLAETVTARFDAGQ